MTAILDTLWFLFWYAVAPFLVIWLLGNFIDSCQHGTRSKNGK